MKTTLIGLKLTPAENDCLDWLTSHFQSPNRCETIRILMRMAASRYGLQQQVLLDSAAERKQARPRQRRTRKQIIAG